MLFSSGLVIERIMLFSDMQGGGADFRGDVGVRAADCCFGDAAAGSVLQVRFQGAETPRARAPPPSPECASSCFQTQLLNSIHPREGTKKWLFIRILVLYCSASHKRGFIM